MADMSEMTKSAAKTVQRNPTGLAAAGAALVALPYAAQGAAKLASKAREKAGSGEAKLTKLGGKAADRATGKAKEIAGDAAAEKLKPSGLGSMLGGALGIGGSGSGEQRGSDDAEGSDGGDATGSGRRMPIQQAVDVAAPLKATYNRWTSFEDWPNYMHRVESVQQDDEGTISVGTKVWGVNRKFKAEIVEQRPDERIEWDVDQGLAHTGVVTFHELAPRLTRIEVTLDVQPQGVLEKLGHGMRFTKRAVRGDLHRFKAHAEMLEKEERGWRGTIEDREVKRKTERKASGRSRSKRANASGRRRNGSDPAKGAGKSRSRS